MWRGKEGWRGLMEEGRSMREGEEGDRGRSESGLDRRSDIEADKKKKWKGEEEEKEEGRGDGEGAEKLMALREGEEVREGVERLMGKYPVMVCACATPPSSSVGTGSTAGSWQCSRTFFPPVAVFHTRHPSGPPLLHELRAVYGRVPALVELSVQARAPVPEKWRR
ncbi:unnamed protein product [Closterium sp. Naga37s-1]|nr:unnamed protein product [Closterium sp. Naga37s-1]